MLVYRGSLLPSPSLSSLSTLPRSLRDRDSRDGSSSEGQQLDWGTVEAPCLRQSVLFTDDPDIVAQESSRVPLLKEEISCFDEGQQLPPLLLLASAASTARDRERDENDRETEYREIRENRENRENREQRSQRQRAERGTARPRTSVVGFRPI